MKAVIFDMDGVIVNSEKYWIEEEEEIYSEAVSSDKIDVEVPSGTSISNTYDYIDRNYGAEVSREEFFHMYEKRAEEIYLEKSDLMPGLKDLIQTIRDKGIKIGLATGSYWPKYVIDRYNLSFNAVMHSGKIEGKGKPEPETYRKTVDKLGVKYSDAVAVDDTDAGTESAKRAGLYCIGHNNSEEQSFERTDEIVENPEELRKRLLELIEQ